MSSGMKIRVVCSILRTYAIFCPVLPMHTNRARCVHFLRGYKLISHWVQETFMKWYMCWLKTICEVNYFYSLKHPFSCVDISDKCTWCFVLLILLRMFETVTLSAVAMIMRNTIHVTETWKCLCGWWESAFLILSYLTDVFQTVYNMYTFKFQSLHNLICSDIISCDQGHWHMELTI